MAKITFIISDTDTGLVSVECQVEGGDEPTNALRMASDVGSFMDALASKVAGDSIAPMAVEKSIIALPHGARSH